MNNQNEGLFLNIFKLLFNFSIDCVNFLALQKERCRNSAAFLRVLPILPRRFWQLALKEVNSAHSFEHWLPIECHQIHRVLPNFYRRQIFTFKSSERQKRHSNCWRRWSPISGASRCDLLRNWDRTEVIKKQKPLNRFQKAWWKHREKVIKHFKLDLSDRAKILNAKQDFKFSDRKKNLLLN